VSFQFCARAAAARSLMCFKNAFSAAKNDKNTEETVSSEYQVNSKKSALICSVDKLDLVIKIVVIWVRFKLY